MYPSVITTFSYPTPTDRLNNPSHSALHNTTSSAVGQIQTFLGTVNGATASAVGTILYDVRSPNSNGGGHIQTANKGGTGQTTYTKGDLLVAINTSTLSKVAIGQDDDILTTDVSTPTGVKWSSPSSILSDTIDYVQGALSPGTNKTYFNIQLPFNLYSGASVSAVTNYTNWNRSDATDVFVAQGGVMVDFQSTGAAYMQIEAPWFRTSTLGSLNYANTNIVVLDWFSKLPSSPTGDISMGFTGNNAQIVLPYNSTARSFVGFTQSSTIVYATSAKDGVGATNIPVSSLATSFNTYRVVFNISSMASYYIGGSLVATISGANIPNTVDPIGIGFGRSNTADFQVTAPNFAIKLK